MSKRITPEERFLSNIAPADIRGCRVWTSQLSHNGYGRLRVDRSRRVPAHVFAWVRAHGPVADGLRVCHSCDNPPCVNIDHLFLGTHLDNMRDMVAKCRQSRGANHYAVTRPDRLPRGSAHGMAKLSESAVADIRQRCAAGELRASMALRYGVTPTLIGMVVRREIWRHIA